MKPTDRKFREKIIAACYNVMEMTHPEVLQTPGGCLHWAFTVVEVLKLAGVHAVVNAGSMSWPRLTPEQDDGKETTLTHFTYLWEPDSPATLENLKNFKLPEMHVWAGIPGNQEIIDLSTGYIAEHCVKGTGMDWPGPKPPAWLWCNVQNLPERVYYTPNRQATEIAYQFSRGMFPVCVEIPVSNPRRFIHMEEKK